FQSVPAEACRPTGPAAAEASPLSSNLLDSNPCTPLSFMNSTTRSTDSAPAWNPKLPPPIEMNAGALQPWAVRQVTTPRPCSPPTMNAPFAMSGTTAIHLASLSTSSGMPLSGAAMISWRTLPAACKRALVASTPEPANPTVANDKTNNAIPYFFIKHSLFHCTWVCGRTCEGRYPPFKDQAV